MKTMKKVLALVVVAVMMMAFAVTANAATITINQPTPSDGTAGAESYNMYKIFDVTKTDEVTEPVTGTIGAGTATGFSYTISTNNPWFAVLGTVSGTTWSAASGQNWVTLTPSAGDSTKYNVTWAGENTEAAAKEFADWLLSKKGSIAADKTMNSNGTTATSGEVADGYWLITSTLGTNLVLATSNITINTKNEYITDNKSVAKTNYNVGDQVEYTINVNLPASVDYTKPVIVHDTMDDVLALTDASVAAKIGTDDFTGITLVKSDAFGTDHDASHTGTGKVLFDFVLDISSLAPAAGAEPEAKTITITYTAELLSTAAADTGYVNKEFVEYSKYKTTPNNTTAETYDFDLEKTFTGSTGDEPLEATFNLYASDSGAKAASPIELVEETKYESYVKADSDDTTKTTTITAKLGTTLKVRGLAAGTYYLTELTTAEGYNLLTEDIVIVIDDEGNATVSGTSELFSASNDKITVVNKTGTVLPSTGGMGTTILYTVGGILVLGAAILLVVRRRVGAGK
jgi:fimbrial isopeptide formation D2 family protein/LPXTG-motif cell wall-anchored protein